MRLLKEPFPDVLSFPPMCRRRSMVRFSAARIDGCQNITKGPIE